VISPTAGESQRGPGTWLRLAREILNGIAELRVFSFGQSSSAEIERRLYRRDQFVLGISLRNFLSLGIGDVADFRAEEIVGVGDVRSQMREGHLIWRRFGAELVCRHFFD